MLVDPGLVRFGPGADAGGVVVPVVVLVARVEAARPRRVLARRSGTGGRQRNAGAGRRCPSNRLLSRGRALGTITQVREGDAPPRHRAGFRKAVELHARAGAALSGRATAVVVPAADRQPRTGSSGLTVSAQQRRTKKQRLTGFAKKRTRIRIRLKRYGPGLPRCEFKRSKARSTTP